MTAGTGPATSSGSAVTLAMPDLKRSSLPFLTCATGPYRPATLFANGPWVPKSSQGYGPDVLHREGYASKQRAGSPLGCSIVEPRGQPPAIFCWSISIALATAVASSACTSGGMPTLLY